MTAPERPWKARVAVPDGTIAITEGQCREAAVRLDAAGVKLAERSPMWGAL